MKKEKVKRIIVLWSILAMAFCMQISASAASASNPLKDMPTESTRIVAAVLGTGCDFFTPSYTSDFKMTATSSNKKVATVKVYDFYRNGQYSKGYLVTQKGYGSTKIKVTVEIGGKTYTKTCKYTFYKYSNPFSKFKIGSKAYTKKMSSAYLYLAKSKLTGKLTFKLKSGYKFVRAWCRYGKNVSKMKELKNNSKLPSNVAYIYITLRDTKKNLDFTVCISRK